MISEASVRRLSNAQLHDYQLHRQNLHLYIPTYPLHTATCAMWNTPLRRALLLPCSRLPLLGVKDFHTDVSLREDEGSSSAVPILRYQLFLLDMFCNIPRSRCKFEIDGPADSSSTQKITLSERILIPNQASPHGSRCCGVANSK